METLINKLIDSKDYCRIYFKSNQNYTKCICHELIYERSAKENRQTYLRFTCLFYKDNEREFVEFVANLDSIEAISVIKTETKLLTQSPVHVVQEI